MTECIWRRRSGSRSRQRWERSAGRQVRCSPSRSGGVRMHILDDVLRPGLRIVFCGTAAGTVSAARGAYYAGPGNKFWPMLFEIGLTPYRMEPAKFREVSNFGIGLTDIVKGTFGADSSLPNEAFDVPDFTARIRAVRPAVLAFNGKKAAAALLGLPTRRISYGPASPLRDFPPIWVLPSTSGAAARSWDPQPWHALARSC